MSTKSHSTGPEMSQADERGHVNTRAVVITTIVLFASLLAGMGLMQIYFNILDSRAAANEPKNGIMVDTAARPPEPRLQFSNIHQQTEADDLHTMRAAEDSLLHSYGWVDQPNKVARLPIERAIDLIAERGTGSVHTSAAPVPSAAAPASDSTHAAAPAAATPAPAVASEPAGSGSAATTVRPATH